MPSLTVDFRGICTHFSHLVPGIPHRVVLPNAMPLRFGLLDVPHARETLPYVLLPHFPVLRAADQTDLTVDGAIIGGLIIEGVRLHVANAIGEFVDYHTDYDRVAHLAHYVDAYQFSDEVVLGGRAACYFDVISGRVEPQFVGDKIAGVRITIPTHKPPELIASPFSRLRFSS